MRKLDHGCGSTRILWRETSVRLGVGSLPRCSHVVWSVEARVLGDERKGGELGVGGVGQGMRL